MDEKRRYLVTLTADVCPANSPLHAAQLAALYFDEQHARTLFEVSGPDGSFNVVDMLEGSAGKITQTIPPRPFNLTAEDATFRIIASNLFAVVRFALIWKVLEAHADGRLCVTCQARLVDLCWTCIPQTGQLDREAYFKRLYDEAFLHYLKLLRQFVKGEKNEG